MNAGTLSMGILHTSLCMGIKSFIPSKSVAFKTKKSFKQSRYLKRIKKLLFRKAVVWCKLRAKPKNKTKISLQNDR